METSPLFARLDTVILRVQDLERACTWYATVLGLPVAYRDPAEGLAVLPLAEGGSLTLWQRKPGEASPGEAVAGTYPIFAATDVAAERDLLRVRGGRVGELVEAPGVRFFTFWDPDGNRLEACQVLSAASVEAGT